MKPGDKMYIAERIQPILRTEKACILPENCEGVLFVFKTKKDAYHHWGKNVPLTPIDITVAKENE